MNLTVDNINLFANPINTSTAKSDIQSSFAGELRDSAINNIIKDIHDNFNLNVGESGHRIECYVPSDVLYEMSFNETSIAL